MDVKSDAVEHRLYMRRPKEIHVNDLPIKRPVIAILLFYLACYSFRLLEYFVLRTDQSVIGEAFVHKLAGVVLLVFFVRLFAIAIKDIGFTRQSIGYHLLLGLFLGIAVFIPAYAMDLFVSQAGGQAATLQFYVSSFSASGNFGHETGIIFFAICIAGNVLNVLMEEGVFRGLFIKLAESKVSFAKAVLMSSLLFGAWHVVGPLREWIDGARSGTGAVMMALVMLLTTAVTGIKFCLLVRWTGSLWTAMADHFFNNTITNVLHVVSASGADEQMTLRIAMAQLLSVIIVVILFVRSKSSSKPTFRTSQVRNLFAPEKRLRNVETN